MFNTTTLHSQPYYEANEEYVYEYGRMYTESASQPHSAGVSQFIDNGGLERVAKGDYDGMAVSWLV